MGLEKVKFKIYTYFGEETKGNSLTTKILIYFFNLMYRSIIPMMSLYLIITWHEAPKTLLILLWATLAFLVLYQFTWEIE